MGELQTIKSNAVVSALEDLLKDYLKESRLSIETVLAPSEIEKEQEKWFGPLSDKAKIKAWEHAKRDTFQRLLGGKKIAELILGKEPVFEILDRSRLDTYELRELGYDII
jgi:hypothetical protein